MSTGISRLFICLLLVSRDIVSGGTCYLARCPSTFRACINIVVDMAFVVTITRRCGQASPKPFFLFVKISRHSHFDVINFWPGVNTRVRAEKLLQGFSSQILFEEKIICRKLAISQSGWEICRLPRPTDTCVNVTKLHLLNYLFSNTVKARTLTLLLFILNKIV